ETLRQALYPRDLEPEEIFQPGVAASPDSLGRKRRFVGEEEIRQALEQCGGNKGRAADALGIDRSTLWRKMQKYGL
ncbi:MAG: AAA family ATPase, partial [Clostridiales bacterium]|nr:AAA family ATPase [Clostridiales bacterium]